jgi:drug/metabolite transporter (DMT)-like permease
MVPLALALALGAALVHALWNLLVAGENDSQGATAVASLAGCVIFAPIVALTFDVQPEAVPWMALSSLVVLVYLWLLGIMYDRSALSVAYPIARGLAPVLVLIAGWVFTAAPATPLQVAAIVTVAAGVLLVRGFRGRAGWRETALADKTGIRYASPLTYMEFVTLGPGLFLVGRLWRRHGITGLRERITPRAVVAGAGMFLAYTMVLAALTLAPAAPVAAVRESSVVMAVALGALFLHERAGRAQVAGAAAVAAGVALLSLR